MRNGTRAMRTIGAILLAGLLGAMPVFARGGSGRGGRHSSGIHHRSSTFCTTCARDARGRIKRSSSERRKFLRSLGLTHTPRGMHVDHIVPLAKGGQDKTSNMQLIRKDSSKERDELR